MSHNPGSERQRINLYQHHDMTSIPSPFIRRPFTTALLALGSLLSPVHASAPAPFADGERVLFLGDSTRAGDSYQSDDQISREMKIQG